MQGEAPLQNDAAELNKYYGLYLALFSGILIGTSFIITKKGLLESQREGNHGAGEGYEYLKTPMWWAGTVFISSHEF